VDHCNKFVSFQQMGSKTFFPKTCTSAISIQFVAKQTPRNFFRQSKNSALRGLRVTAIFRKACQKFSFVCLCQVWDFVTKMSSTLQISVYYKLLSWILLFCDCSKFKYLFLTERICYSGEFCEVSYIWCWSSFPETNHMKPTLKQCLLILQH